MDLNRSLPLNIFDAYLTLKTCLFRRILLFVLIWVAAQTAFAEPLTLKRAVELAIQHSTGIAIATAEENRAEKAVIEARDPYLPQLTVGAGLAYSNGFPLSLENLAPSLLNITSQQFVYNAAQREYMHAAQHQLAAVKKMSEDKREQIVLETAMTYAELDRVDKGMALLRKQQSAAGQIQKVAQERFDVGVDSPVEITKAKLNIARVRLAMEQSSGRGQLLRTRLAQLTGLPADSFETVSDSIPPLPAPMENAAFVSKTVSSNAALATANEEAVAKAFSAKAEHRQLYPSVDGAIQYAMLAHYNNYDVFFRKNTFQRNNLTAGVVIRIPIFNGVQKAHAQEADYESLKARKQAEEIKEQVTTEALKMQQNVRQLAAAREVARLEYELSSTDVKAVEARMDAGSATIRDEENVRLAEGQKYSAFLDMNFDFEKALMQLLNATGDLESWATSGK